ncbi:MAG: O-methyltransferase [Spirochaetales bacterium]|nr:O-methyltransferase [Spirochaetales bacterium]
MNQNVFSKVDHYSRELLNHTASQLYEIEKTMDSLGIPDMSVSPNQGQFLHILAKAINAKRILEIGTFGAYSAIYLAKALPEDGKLISLEIDPFYAEIAKSNITKAGLSHKIEIMLGPALLSLIKLSGEKNPSFDMIFLDADKPNYPNYLDWIMKLCKPGTLIISDNVVREGEVIDPDTADEKVRGVRKFIQGLSQENRLTSTIIQTVSVKGYDGMAISIAG